MVTIAIIGMLASLAVPSMLQVILTAQSMRTASDIRHYASAISQYNLAHGHYPPASAPGVIPNGMDELMPPQFTLETAIGGLWAWSPNQFGANASISIVNAAPTANQIYCWLRVDMAMDDGNLGSGTVRTRPGGLMYIID